MCTFLLKSFVLYRIIKNNKECKEEKPVIISQGLIAASGGYWLSMYGDKIVAAPNTITGSIGVIGIVPQFKRLYDKGFKPIIVSADGATKALIEIGLKPDIIVTDLDGYLPAIVYSNLKNSYVVVHAHGDNIDKLISYVRFFRKIIGTTQVMPLPKIYNFGGFTDGDRCIYLAYSLKARYVLLFGMDFGSKVGRYSKEFISDYKTKIVKLAIGKLLISLLSNRIKIYNATYSKPVIKGVENIEL